MIKIQANLEELAQMHYDGVINRVKETTQVFIDAFEIITASKCSVVSDAGKTIITAKINCLKAHKYKNILNVLFDTSEGKGTPSNDILDQLKKDIGLDSSFKLKYYYYKNSNELSWFFVYLLHFCLNPRRNNLVQSNIKTLLNIEKRIASFAKLINLDIKNKNGAYIPLINDLIPQKEEAFWKIDIFKLLKILFECISTELPFKDETHKKHVNECIKTPHQSTLKSIISPIFTEEIKGKKGSETLCEFIQNRDTTVEKTYLKESENLFKFFDDVSSIKVVNPEDIEYLKAEFYKKAEAYHFTEARAYTKELTIIFEQIFSYEDFADKKKDDIAWDAYRLAEMLNVKTCPYCNQNYILTVIDSKEVSTRPKRKIIRPDFDHFLDKATHPLFRLSFYNLVPSCSVCNSRLKLGKKFAIETHIHPYLDGFGNKAVFSYKFLSPKRQVEVYIDVKSGTSGNDKIKINNNIEAFQLNETYKHHADIVEELLQKYQIYSDAYYRSIQGSLKDLFASDDEFYRYVFGNYGRERDFNKRPLSKLIKDIADELGITTYLSIDLNDE